MADRDLDQYLEGLGIDVHEEEKPEGDLLVTPPDDDAPYDDAPYDDAPYHDAPYDDAAHEAGDSDPSDPDVDRGETARDGRGRREEPPFEPERGRPAAAGADDDFDMETALAAGGLYGVIPDDLSPTERTESFLVNVLLNLDPTYAVEVERVGDEIHAEVFGGDSGRIIGKGGRTLAALEFLTNAVVNRTEAESMRVVIDVGGYKRRRDDRLRQTALKAAARVRKSGYAVELEPMSAAERRVVHMAIAEEAEVESESTGDGRARRVVVKPVA
jgi:spoIIIJ-associated protein